MSLLFNKDEVMLVNRQLAALIGLNEAIVLQQLHYWIQRKTGGVEYAGRRWVFNTMERWREQFPFWSEPTIKRTFQALRDCGLVSAEKLSKVGRDRTNYYSIDYDKLRKLELESHQINLTKSIGSKRPNGSDQIDPMDEIKLIQSNGSKRSDANKNKDYTETTTETSCTRAAELGLVDVSDDLLDDWNKVRKDKKAGNATAAAVKLLQAEARKANLTDSEAITVCCGFGWQGFRAAWYLKDTAVAAMTPNRIRANEPVETYAQRAARQRMEEVAPGAARKVPGQLSGFERAQAFMNGGDVIDVTPSVKQIGD